MLSPTNAGGQRPAVFGGALGSGALSIALQAVTAAMVLMLLLASGAPSLQRPTSIGRDTADVAAARQRAAGAGASPCTWTPYLLPPEAHQWALGAAREKVVTLVHPMRRHLTAQLAAGVLLQGIDGDFVETGVFTGGTSIIMLQALEKYDPWQTRRHWAADSFQGLPPPEDEDRGGILAEGKPGQFTIGREVFLANVRKWNITGLDARLRILEGWFNETLPGAPIHSISFLRLDGDLYASTMDALEALYDKVSPGGIVYVDDYGSFTGCRRAVDEFRQRRGITGPLMLQGMPDQLFNEPPAAAKWEAAWWVKGPC
ncbi:hypothetical protein ABPG75_011079 [Micractinium tetrahymenae]